MIKSNRLIGGVLLIAGTAIGAGMLAIPVATSFTGFFPSLLLFFICWLFLLITAFFLLEVNLSVPGEPNLISMSEKMLGKVGKGVTWVVYLGLLYSLTAAYISGSEPFFTEIFYQIFGAKLSHFFRPLPILVIFGIFIYLGTKPVDYVNRFLMAGLIVGYFLLVVFVPAHVNVSHLAHVDMKPFLVGFPVVITAFGFHIIIPSLTTYLNHDAKMLRKTVLIGSCIPLFIYILWQVLILGVVPLAGPYSMTSAWMKGQAATAPLTHILTNPKIAMGAQFFAFFAIITSFIGVSLSLSDFLTDGLKIKRDHFGRLKACLLTFLPPLLFVYLFKRGFLIALQYAGIFVAILLGVIPALMAWKLKKHPIIGSIYGRVVVILVLLFSVFVILLDIAEEAGYLKILLENYMPVK